jgi:hypothetical protein
VSLTGWYLPCGWYAGGGEGRLSVAAGCGAGMLMPPGCWPMPDSAMCGVVWLPFRSSGCGKYMNPTWRPAGARPFWDEGEPKRIRRLRRRNVQRRQSETRTSAPEQRDQLAALRNDCRPRVPITTPAMPPLAKRRGQVP